MSVRRQSEQFHKGVTDSEVDFALYLQRYNIGYLSQECFCLSCGNHAASFGNVCLKCDANLTLKGSFARPDFFIEHLNQIIPIKGSIHDKPKREALDKYQESKLTALGYKVVSYTNEEVKKLVGK